MKMVKCEKIIVCRVESIIVGVEGKSFKKLLKS
jgi:hypothetical protein